MRMKVAKYISEFFVKQGVTDMFMITGGAAMHLNDAFGHQEGLKITYNHHEQACTIAAEGYTRQTGNCGNADCRHLSQPHRRQSVD